MAVAPVLLALGLRLGVNARAVAQPKHPLDALTGDEIRMATKLLRDPGHADDETLFPSIALEEMDKSKVCAGRRVGRLILGREDSAAPAARPALASLRTREGAEP
jgi:Cu2+-containing amine oxidase